MGSLTLFDAVRRFLDWSRATLAPRSTAVYEHYLSRFKLHAGDVPIDALSPAIVSAWSKKFHPVQSVQRLCCWLHREARLIAANPLFGMRKPTTGQRRRVLERVERLTLLRRSIPSFRRFLIALAETMARPGEIRGLRWSDVRTLGNRPFTLADLLAGRAFFALLAFKGRERRSDPNGVRIIPISRRLGRMLARLFDEVQAMDGRIFVNAKGRAWTENAVRCQLRRLRVRAGIAADVRGERIVAYTFRHSGATEAVAAGVREFILAELLGHASTRTTRRYVHLSPSHLAEAMQRIEATKRPKHSKKDRPR